MESETASSSEEQRLEGGGGVGGGGGPNDNRGKHRILAELRCLEQELKCLEEELEELERTENASMICAELLSHIETISDPLTPTTNGPINVLWDRWFEGPQDSQGCRCLIL
ncbi:hypothetical protein CsatB_005765 [Cannabis sativa]|uniref:guanine nucleotide-binding protein subunit gamma 1 n=1 Tax=Cannabis sativa TaxID=3483 RepID=UPI0029C9C272|nr:guanine nucleotide-binding protein subunit gamma 1 [Cannabis sativa]XP_060961485.1 guanine nucleotide-binding protein subunit gamma 1-like [Cannabis sativa]